MHTPHPGPRRTLADHGVPVRDIVLAPAHVEQHEADAWVADQAGDHDGVAALVLEGAGAWFGGVGAGVEIVGLAV